MEGLLYGIFAFTVCMVIVFVLAAMLYWWFMEKCEECMRERNRKEMSRTLPRVLEQFEREG